MSKGYVDISGLDDFLFFMCKSILVTNAGRDNKLYVKRRWKIHRADFKYSVLS